MAKADAATILYATVLLHMEKDYDKEASSMNLIPETHSQIRMFLCQFITSNALPSRENFIFSRKVQNMPDTCSFLDSSGQLHYQKHVREYFPVILAGLYKLLPKEIPSIEIRSIKDSQKMLTKKVGLTWSSVCELEDEMF